MVLELGPGEEVRDALDGSLKGLFNPIRDHVLDSVEEITADVQRWSFFEQVDKDCLLQQLITRGQCWKLVSTQGQYSKGYTQAGFMICGSKLQLDEVKLYVFSTTMEQFSASLVRDYVQKVIPGGARNCVEQPKKLLEICSMRETRHTRMEYFPYTGELPFYGIIESFWQAGNATFQLSEGGTYVHFPDSLQKSLDVGLRQMLRHVGIHE